MTETTVTVSPTTSAATSPNIVRPLPPQFADLEQFSDWILETWRERYEKRLASTIAEMQEFYDAVLPRLEEIFTYSDQFDLHDLPDDVRNLVLLVSGLVEASFPVEIWRQPRVPDTGAADIFMISEPPL